MERHQASTAPLPEGFRVQEQPGEIVQVTPPHRQQWLVGGGLMLLGLLVLWSRIQQLASFAGGPATVSAYVAALTGFGCAFLGFCVTFYRERWRVGQDFLEVRASAVISTRKLTFGGSGARLELQPRGRSGRRRRLFRLNVTDGAQTCTLLVPGGAEKQRAVGQFLAGITGWPFHVAEP